MRIMLTNDDGLHAPGIEALHATLTGTGDAADLTSLADVTTIAPLTVQSATSHGVTFHQPLMVSERHVTPDMEGIAVDGRPADCVKLAFAALWQEKHGADTKPDLVISGMNSGANCGINVIYSGTVAAALEAAFLGVPSIAVSLLLGKIEPDYQTAARFARQAIDAVLANGMLDPHTCININIPMCRKGDLMPEIVVCPMNTHGLNDAYVRRESPMGDVYYWAAGSGLDFRGTAEDSDVDHLMKGRITVTPLEYDLTAHGATGPWRDRLA